MAHVETPNEVAMHLEGKSREQMVPILKAWRDAISSTVRTDAYREGWDEGYHQGSAD